SDSLAIPNENHFSFARSIMSPKNRISWRATRPYWFDIEWSSYATRAGTAIDVGVIWTNLCYLINFRYRNCYGLGVAHAWQPNLSFVSQLIGSLSKREIRNACQIPSAGFWQRCV